MREIINNKSVLFKKRHFIRLYVDMNLYKVENTRPYPVLRSQISYLQFRFSGHYLITGYHVLERDISVIKAEGISSGLIWYLTDRYRYISLSMYSRVKGLLKRQSHWRLVK